MCILTYLSILRLIPIQTLVIWLLVGCCESGCPVIKVTLVKYGRWGRIDLGSPPYGLSQESFLAIPLSMHGGYVGSFLLSIKLIISFLFFNKKNWCMTRYRQTKVFFARVYTM